MDLVSIMRVSNGVEHVVSVIEDYFPMRFIRRSVKWEDDVITVIFVVEQDKVLFTIEHFHLKMGICGVGEDDRWIEVEVS